MLNSHSIFYKYFLLGFAALSLAFSSIGASARNVVISGKIINFKESTVRPIIRVYLPGSPYYDKAKNEFKLISTTKYNTDTGYYTVTVDGRKRGQGLFRAFMMLK